MKEKLKIAGYAQRGVVPLALGVAVTMWLWNALIPEIVGSKAINHGQSLGLLVLLRLLFGHFGYFGRGGFGRPHMSRREHRRLHEAMRGMSHSEKREFIRRRMRELCERCRRHTAGGENTHPF